MDVTQHHSLTSGSSSDVQWKEPPLSLRVEDARSVLREVYEMHAPLARRGQIVLLMRCPLEPVWIRCDRARLVHSISNLTIAALAGSAKAGIVDVAIERRPTGIAFTVAHEDRDALERRWGGIRVDCRAAALGLEIARGIAEAHGATITREEGPEGAKIVLEFSTSREVRSEDEVTS